jgi:hypothetical protein
MRLHADEMALFARFEERHALAHQRVGNDHARLRFGMGHRPVERFTDSVEIVAVDALHMPAEGFQLGRQRFEIGDLAGGAIGLHAVDIDNGDQVVEPEMGSRQDSLPDRSLVEFAIGKQGVDPAGRLLGLEAEAFANRNRQAKAQRPARHFHAGRIGGHSRHRQTAVIAPIGVEFAVGNDPGLDQRGIKRDRVMAVGQQEPVTAVPCGVVGPVVHGMEIGDRQHIGDVQRLGDVALALHRAHQHGIAADLIGVIGKRPVRTMGFGHGWACLRSGRSATRLLGPAALTLTHHDHSGPLANAKARPR